MPQLYCDYMPRNNIGMHANSLPSNPENLASKFNLNIPMPLDLS